MVTEQVLPLSPHHRRERHPESHLVTETVTLLV